MSASNVYIFNGVTSLDFPPDRMLEAAMGRLKSVVILGDTTDGLEFFSSSLASGPEVLWMLARAQKKLLDMTEQYDS